MIACSEVTELSDTFIDGELLVDVQAKIMRHLRGCDGCAALVECKRRLKRLVRASVRSLTVPASLRFRVLTEIGA
jgi:anti-sigma factor (TIGR02949 family)